MIPSALLPPLDWGDDDDDNNADDDDDDCDDDEDEEEESVEMICSVIFCMLTLSSDSSADGPL